MPRGKKTAPETIYKIMTSWAVTKNYKETADNLGIAVSTVKKIVDEHRNDDKFEKLCKQKEREFSQRADAIINKALDRLERSIDDEEKDIPINHLTTAIGTLFDKKALSEGNSTENVKVEVKLPPGVDEYAG